MRGRAQRVLSGRASTWPIAAAAGAAALLLSAVAFSPLLMLWATAIPVDWNRLSAIGQTYGAISAFVATLAFLGVTWSLIMQRQQAQLAQEQVIRERHFELTKLLIEHPVLVRAWGRPDGAATPLATYAGLIMNHWLMLWRIGDLDEHHLRELLQQFFRSEIGRTYWGWSRNGFNRSSRRNPDRLRQRFVEIVDAELDTVESSGAPTISWPQERKDEAAASAPSPAQRRTGRAETALLWLTVGAMAGAATTLVARTRRSRRP